MKEFKFLQTHKYIGNLRIESNINLFGKVAVVVRSNEEWNLFVTSIGLEYIQNSNNMEFFPAINVKHVIGRMFDSYYVYGRYQNPIYQDSYYDTVMSYVHHSIRRERV